MCAKSVVDRLEAATNSKGENDQANPSNATGANKDVIEQQAESMRASRSRRRTNVTISEAALQNPTSKRWCASSQGREPPSGGHQVLLVEPYNGSWASPSNSSFAGRPTGNISCMAVLHPCDCMNNAEREPQNAVQRRKESRLTFKSCGPSSDFALPTQYPAVLQRPQKTEDLERRISTVDCGRG